MNIRFVQVKERNKRLEQGETGSDKENQCSAYTNQENKTKNYNGNLNEIKWKGKKNGRPFNMDYFTKSIVIQPKVRFLYNFLFRKWRSRIKRLPVGGDACPTHAMDEHKMPIASPRRRTIWMDYYYTVARPDNGQHTNAFSHRALLVIQLCQLAYELFEMQTNFHVNLFK